MTEQYLAAISLIERLHRHFLNVVKSELDSSDIRDTNNVQATILFNIGDVEMTVGELTLRGCYLGSNVSYNLKKMVENGYVEQASRRTTVARPSQGDPEGPCVARSARGDAPAACRKPAMRDYGAGPGTRRGDVGQLERFWVRVSDKRALLCSIGSITPSASNQPRN